MFKHYNKNPQGKNVGDCTVRAISKATGMDWDCTYMALCMQGLTDADMPSSNAVWGHYLSEEGYRRHLVQDTCPDCYTVCQFSADHPAGTFILALSGHVVCVENGDWYDSWDSGNEVILYYWAKERMK